MAEHATTRFFTGAHRDFARDNFANTAQPKLATFHVAFHLLAVFQSRAFRSNYHSSKVTGRFARIDHARDPVVIERDFGNQNDIGATGNTALQCDPSCVPSHHFDDNDPPMAGRRSMQPVQRVHYYVNGRIETERGCRRFKIIVDRLRYADAVDAGLLQLLRSHQRAVAANNDQRSHPEVFQDRSGVRDDLCRNYCSITRAGLRNEMAAIGSTENRSSKGHDSVYGLPIENDVIARRQQAFKAIAKPNHFPSKLVRCQYYGAQNRVEPGTIATAGQNTNARFHFRRSEIRALSLDQPSDPQPPIDRTAASRVASGLRLLRIG